MTTYNPNPKPIPDEWLISDRFRVRTPKGIETGRATMISGDGIVIALPEGPRFVLREYVVGPA